ncbi:MAG: ShlB/FhaC/HecB family hemolysin secretion/activation protein [Candidatus Omnitrophica bacterium]|nr:ShlB/FhaC/HecB family hemolysin secretion/activation protein [Candidatus Omnitrophota bacterium]
MVRLKVKILSLGILSLSLGFFIQSGDLFAANEDRTNFGASAAVQESKIRDQAQEQLFQPKAAKPIAFEEEQAPEAPATGPSFFVKKVFLEGDVMLESSEYEPLLKKFEGREVRFEELQRLINALEQLFRAKGFIAVVLLPPQKMENQEIHLKAVTSRMGELLIENNRYYAKWRTRAYWRTPKGAVLWYDKIRKDVMDMNENPDRTVKPILRAGAEKGTTDVVLDVQDHLPLHMGYSFDNQGVKLTGKDRQGFTLRNNNMLGLDDTFLIGTTFGDVFGALYLYHVIPISNFGTKFIWSFSHAQVNPHKQFTPYGINGTSETYSLALQQRVIRTDKYSGNVQLGFDFKEKHTTTQSVTTAWDKERVISLTGNLQSRDRWGGWGLGQGFYFGLPTFGDGWPLASGNGVQSFFKYTYSLTRVTQLPWRTKAVWDLQGQLSPDPLLPQEQMFLGGANSIRGYPESDYGADQAIQSRLDYLLPPYKMPDQWKVPFDTAPLKDQLNAILFWDTGYGRAHDPAGNSENKGDYLMGVGGGFELRFRSNITTRVQWGVPLGDKPITEGGRSQIHFTFSVNY